MSLGTNHTNAASLRKQIKANKFRTPNPVTPLARKKKHLQLTQNSILQNIKKEWSHSSIFHSFSKILANLPNPRVD
jgi:hypothetical protein